jgi:transposase-like protein
MLYIISQKFALGLPYNKIRSHLKEHFGINVSEKTLCDSVQGIAKYLGPEFDKIVDEIQQLKAIHVDETGWRINGRNCWLWAFITKKASLITIEKNRDLKNGWAQISMVQW